MPNLTCECGERLPRSSFPNGNAYRLIPEKTLRASCTHPDAVKLADLFFFEGAEAHQCPHCKKMLIYGRGSAGPQAVPSVFQPERRGELSSSDAAHLPCPCGKSMDRNSAHRLVSEVALDQLPEPLTAEILFQHLVQGSPEMLSCPACHRMAMIHSAPDKEPVAVIYSPIRHSLQPRGTHSADMYVGGSLDHPELATPVDVYSPTSTKLHHIGRHIWQNHNQVSRIALNLRQTDLHPGHFGSQLPAYHGRPGHGHLIKSVDFIK
jgi:hypothetical protein